MTHKFSNLEDVYQSLTEYEIHTWEDCAVINAKGVGKIRIGMISAYEYYSILKPFFEGTFDVYARLLQYSMKDKMNKESLEKYITEKVNFMLGLFGSQEEVKVSKRLLTELQDFFFFQALRREFWKTLKKLRVIPWHVSFKRFERSLTMIDMVTIFVYLWLFNEYGVKKKYKFLLDKVESVINTESMSSSGMLSKKAMEKQSAELKDFCEKSFGLKVQRLGS